MTTKSNHDLVAETFASQLHNDALHLGQAIEGEFGTLGAKDIGKNAMLDLVARNWNDPNPTWGPQHQTFRAWLLLTMGPTHFMALYEDGAKKGLLHPDPPMGMMGAAGFSNGTTAPLPPTLAVNPTPPSLPGPLVAAMTNANG